MHGSLEERVSVTWDEVRTETTTARGGLGRTPEENLAAWWVGKAQEETEGLVAKAVAYGGHDLLVMGKAMQAFMPEGTPMEVAVEAAVAFYALGKVARLIEPLAKGQKASADSWYDLGVYARMGQHVQERGPWPFGGSWEGKE